MNLLVKKFGQATSVLLLAILIISCEDPGNIGLNLDGSNGVVVTRFSEVVLPTSLVQFDPRNTLRSPSIQVGKYTDPNFGITSSKSFSRVNLTSFIPDMDESAVFDEFIMEVGFQSFYGTTPENGDVVNLYLHQLTEELDTAGNYTRVSELPYNPTPLGTWTFEPSLLDTLQTDSVYVMPLDNSVGIELFDKLKAGDPIFEDNVNFNAYFKGIAWVGDVSNESIYYLNTGVFRIKIKYHEVNSSGEDVDQEYTMNSSGYRFFNLDSDKTGTPLDGISPDNSDFITATDYQYAQLGNLIALKMDFSVFYEITDTIENLVINSAEIKVGTLESFEDDNGPPSVMQVYFTDVANTWPIKTADGAEFVQLQQEGVPAGAYGFTENIPLTFSDDDDPYNSASYAIPISSFLQQLHSGKFDDEDTPLEPEATIYLYPETDVLFPQQLFSISGANQYTVHKDSIRLKIYYTIPSSNDGNN